MKFRWEKVGRAFVAHFGNLSVSVDERGNNVDGHRWRVREVFGMRHFPTDWRDNVQEALGDAERIAIREARYLAKILAGKARA